jgi:hypothetical protein
MQTHPLISQPSLLFSSAYSGVPVFPSESIAAKASRTLFVFVTYPWYSVKWFFNRVSLRPSIPINFP